MHNIVLCIVILTMATLELHQYSTGETQVLPYTYSGNFFAKEKFHTNLVVAKSAENIMI